MTAARAAPEVRTPIQVHAKRARQGACLTRPFADPSADVASIGRIPENLSDRFAVSADADAEAARTDGSSR